MLPIEMGFFVYNALMPTQTLPAPWSSSADEVLKAFKTSSSTGLSRVEAARRLAADGPNEVERETVTPAGRILLRQFSSPLVLILIVASGLSVLLGDRIESVIIMVMVLAGGLLGFVQEYRSERTLRQLRKKLSRHATVIRGGRPLRVPAPQLVKGDIVELDLGTIVPADLRLIRLNDLEIDESLITGESVPVPKSVEPLHAATPLPQDQTNMALAGTHVAQGSGYGVVVATGGGTEVGKTAALLGGAEEETSFQQGVRQFGSFLLKITVAMAVLTAGVLGLIHGQWSEALLFALALAVGISPELLPVVVTINMSAGALAMSRKSVLVKKLVAIEDLGNADVFCTDKTGTLTVGKLRVRGSMDPGGRDDPTALACALHCLELTPHERPKNPIDQAILDGARTSGVKPYVKDVKVIDTIAFDFERRRMSCVVEGADGRRRLIVKGATTEVLAACNSCSAPQRGAITLAPDERRRIAALADGYHDRGERLIAVAQKPVEKKDAYTPADETALELVGFLRVSDAPKDTAKAAIQSLARLNTRIVILTGDVERVTRYVAEQLDFAVTGVLTGEDVERMDDAALSQSVERVNVFARITPSHKLRIIRAFKAAGHTVGFMGDGVNDAPALRAADVGISFEHAVDVAKEAADVVLLKRNLSVLADGIREGRRIFVNTRTYVFATISSNFGNMLTVAGAALLLPFIPLLPAQIILLNILSDLPMLAVSTDRVAEEELAKPKKWDIAQISNFMYFFGAISSLADYATFAILLIAVRADMYLFRSGWFLESLLTELVIIFLVRSRRVSWANRPSAWLVRAAVATLVLGGLFLYTALRLPFGLVPLDPFLVLLLLGIVAAYAVLTELGKAAYFRYANHRSMA